MGKIVGIDLGTTNSVVAVIERGRPVIIPNRLGKQSTPSVVQIMSDHRTLVGIPAVRAMPIDPKNTVSGIKRFMGRYYNEVFDIAEVVPFDVVPGSDQRAVVRAHGRDYTPEAISALILDELKCSAEAYLGEPVHEAVLTIPAHFNESQRRATRRAAELAGFKVLRTIVEPTAAALAHGLGNKPETILLVLDLGGGTFDVTLVEEGDRVCYVIAVGGDPYLGGDDFDDILYNWVRDEIRRIHGIDISEDPTAAQRVREAVTSAKCRLSFHATAEICIPFLRVSGWRSVDVLLTIARSHFEHLAEELFERIISIVLQVLKNGKMTPPQVDNVLLVGGASRVPKLAEIVRRIFGSRLLYDMNMEEAIAAGAATQAGIMSGELRDIVLLDVIDFPISIEAAGQVVEMIPAGTTIPTQKKELFSTVYDNQPSVEVHVLRGNQPSVNDNYSLTAVHLNGIMPAPAGVPRISVTVDVDANHDISILAQDLATGKTVRGTVE